MGWPEVVVVVTAAAAAAAAAAACFPFSVPGYKLQGSSLIYFGPGRGVVVKNQIIYSALRVLYALKHCSSHRISYPRPALGR